MRCWEVLVFSFFVAFSNGANILAIFPIPSLSHFVMFGRLLKGLAEKGHQLDVVSHFSSQIPISGYNDISIRGSSPILTNNFTVDLVKDMSYEETLDIITSMAGTKVCEATFQTEVLQDLKKSTKKYDLLITELFGSDCMLGWAHHFGIPSVVMTSSVTFPWATDRFGLPDNPSYIPSYFVEYESKMTLYQRIVNTLTHLEGKIWYEYHSNRPSNIMAKNFFGEDLPDLKVLASNSSLYLVNSHFSINVARPLVPNVVEVAGLHIEEPNPLNEHFSEILETNTRGVIYFTMGSLILTETLPIVTIRAMFDALAELPYKVIWKANKENFPKGLKFPKNIHFEPWMPQLDILCHPNVKLFISHGGMMGTQESIHCGVPILGIPIFADQSLNIRHAEAMGYGIMIRLNSITKDSILTAAKKLLYDPTYSQNAKRVSTAFKDRPMTPLETSIYWIEYVIRHRGAPQLQSAAKTLSWYQYYLLDVMAVLIGVPCVLFYIGVVLFKTIFVGKSKGKSKQKVN